jgi:hypothetical protein
VIADFLQQLSVLDLTAPQYQSVLSMLSQLQQVIEQKTTDAESAYDRGKNAARMAHNRCTNGAQPDRVSPKEKSNPPSHSEAKASEHPRAAQGVNDLVWLECPSTLEKLGLSTRSARSNLGRWLKQTKSPERVLEAVRAADRAGTQDPVPYIVEALKPRVVAFSGDWEAGAERQIAERNEALAKKLSPDEREAQYQKMKRLRDKLRGVAGSEDA